MDEKQIYKTVQYILIKEWDPIGVGDIPEAQDEYEMYEAGLIELIKARCPEAEIFQRLRYIECDRIGLKGSEDHTRKIAQKLYSLGAEY